MVQCNPWLVQSVPWIGGLLFNRLLNYVSTIKQPRERQSPHSNLLCAQNKQAHCFKAHSNFVFASLAQKSHIYVYEILHCVPQKKLRQICVLVHNCRCVRLCKDLTQVCPSLLLFIFPHSCTDQLVLSISWERLSQRAKLTKLWSPTFYQLYQHSTPHHGEISQVLVPRLLSQICATEELLRGTLRLLQLRESMRNRVWRSVWRYPKC